MRTRHLTYMLLSFATILNITTIISCGGDSNSSPSEKTADNIAINIDASGLDIDVSQKFTTSFDFSVNVTSVNKNTYFIVPSNAINTNLSAKTTDINPTTCNLSNAVSATVAQVSTGECDVAFTLTPESSLDYGVEYTICLTTGVVACNPGKDGTWIGAMQNFTTVAEVGACVITNSCTEECGVFGYSNNDGVSCYSDSNCEIECSGDTTQPEVTITSNESTLTAFSPFTTTITFSEEVSGFKQGDITVTNGESSTLTTIVENKTYSTSITPSDDPTTVTVSIAAGAVTDANDNVNTASNTFSIRYDTSHLTATITADGVTDPTNAAPFSTTITFSEAVNGFVIGDITVNNGTASNFNSTNNPTFTTDIAASEAGLVTINVGAEVATDTLTEAKLNDAAQQLSRTYDNSPPEVSSTSPLDDSDDIGVNTTIAVTFTEAMNTDTITTNTGDTECDGSLQVSSDTFSTCFRMDNNPVATNDNKTFTVTPGENLIGETTYKIRVTNSAADVAGNTTTESTSFHGFTTASTNKIIYVTDNFHNGNLGGTTGADAKCNDGTDANHPGSGTYKAMLTTSTLGVPARVACTTANCSGGPSEHDDWVLLPNQQYVRNNGSSIIGTTNANAIFEFPLDAAFSTVSDYAWGGYYTTWVPYENKLTEICDNWNSNSNSNGGRVGDPDVTVNNAISNSTKNCDEVHRLYCAEQ